MSSINIEETFVGREKKYQGNIISVDKVFVQLPNGKSASRDVVVHPGAACVIPLTNEGEMHLVKQYRATVGKVLLEIPAGKLDKDEDPKQCAIRELHEETGLEAEKVEHILSIYTAVGFSDECIHMYLATGLKEGKAHTDEDEFLIHEKVKVDKLIDMVFNHEIQDSKTIIAVLLADKLLKEAKA